MDTNGTQQVNGSNGTTSSHYLPVDFRALRGKKSITDVAKKIGFSGPSVGNVENRRTTPGAYLLAALAQYHRVSFEDAWASYRPGDPLPPHADIEAAYMEAKKRAPKKAKKKPAPKVAAKPVEAKAEPTDEKAAAVEDQEMLLKTLKDLVAHELKHGRSAVEIIRIVAELDEARIEATGQSAA